MNDTDNVYTTITKTHCDTESTSQLYNNNTNSNDDHIETSPKNRQLRLSAAAVKAAADSPCLPGSSAARQQQCAAAAPVVAGASVVPVGQTGRQPGPGMDGPVLTTRQLSECQGTPVLSVVRYIHFINK